MSLRANAPYADRVEEDGRILIYEGHDVNKTTDTPIPKTMDQPMNFPGGTLTQNGQFFKAAKAYTNKEKQAELVRVYEKLHAGIWVYNGIFRLTDTWKEKNNNREVFKFKLELSEEVMSDSQKQLSNVDHNRMIPSEVKLEVWKRDKGKCVICGSTKNLHFDHDLPFSKGGTSLTAKNIQIMCAKHNLSKGAKIQ
jgi:hypothetical protein